ncbi:hypothetical protein DOTSEDRAFT_33504 [Dothistroma septosporum NZE10]|uniref:Uncharacterized protein n=1 Tax=Dothistroma septosporum (strain NZE10 / CBS 128990) TaxID=675120 RepID=N1PR84_DOTSN|nr:hypothetical protein DOTSEDRAFT_33504 [Dothistroma septosporum NZE10]
MASIAIISLLAIAARSVTASFIIANTTSCYGEFFVGACYNSVQVISPGVDFNESFTCGKLHHAQSARYIKSGTAGPHSSDFTSTGDVCGEGRLYFQRNYTATSTNGTFDIFKGSDASGDSIGKCETTGTNVTDSKRRCSQLMGTIFFEGAYRCNTTVCGDNGSTTTSISSSTASTSSISSTSSSSDSTTVTASSSITSSTITSASGSTTSTSASDSTSSASATDTASTSSETASESTSTADATTSAASKRSARNRRRSG